MLPKILTELPGPEAQKVLEKDRQFISQSYTRVYPLVVKKGEGVWVEDVDSNRFLDFTSGIAVYNTGHCHPKIVAAIQRQAEQLIHMSGTDFYYEAQSNLAEKLAEITPGLKEKRVFFGNSGAEAIEAALKLARYHTKRSRIIAFLGAFHGRTMGALSLTASKVIQEKGFFPLVPGDHPRSLCLLLPLPCPFGVSGLRVQLVSIGFARTSSSGASPRRKWLPSLLNPFRVKAAISSLRRNSIKNSSNWQGISAFSSSSMRFRSGMGRTGKMFAIEHWGLVPDIIAIAKGIASGMPLGAMVSQSEVMTWIPGSHASTFGGNPISCQAALATIELLQGGLIQNAASVGDYILGQLRELQKRFPLIGDIRGKGLMIGVELVKDPVTKEKAIEERSRIIQACFEKGLLILGCGENVIRLIPPLIITKEEADTALTILEEVLQKVR